MKKGKGRPEGRYEVWGSRQTKLPAVSALALEHRQSDGLVSIQRLKRLARKIPEGQGAGAFRSLVLNDPDDLPMARMQDYWNVALHALPPR